MTFQVKTSQWTSQTLNARLPSAVLAQGQVLGLGQVLPATISVRAITSSIRRARITAASNVGASKELYEPNHAGNRGGASLWWSWTAPATGTVTFDTQGSDFDTLLAVYTGGSVGALTVVASNDDAIGRQSRVSFVAQQGVVYHIAVDGYSGATGSIVLNWSQAGAIGPGPGPGPGPGVGSDSFSSRSGISGASGAVAASNVGTSKEFGEPNHAGNRGGASLWWSWTAPATGTVTFDTQGSDFDTLLAVYTGGSVGGLTLVASDDDTIGRQSQVSFTAQQGVVYHIAVDGYSGATGSIVLNWSQAGAIGPGPGPGPGPGVGSDSFSSRSGISGASGAVAASNIGASKELYEPNHAGNRGGASLWWSWTAPATGTVTFDTQGSDFDTLLAVYTGGSVGALTVVASNDDAIGRQSRVSFVAQQGVVYHIAVDGYSGATGSIVLNWSQAGAIGPGPGPGPGPGVGSDSFSSRSGISGASGAVAASNVGTSKEFGEPNHAGNRGGASLWWSWTAPATGTVTFDTQGSDFDTLLAVYTGGSVGGLTLVASNDDAIGRQSQVSFTAQQGMVYHIAVDGYSGATGSIVLNWSQAGGPGPGPGPGPGVGSDSFSSRSGISGASGAVAASNVGASKEFGEPNHARNRGGASLWWSWTAPATGTVTFDTQGSDFDTLLAVYTGSSVGALTVVASNDDAIGRQSEVSFVAQQGMVYQIAVDGYSGATGSIVLNWSQAGVPDPDPGPGPGPDPGTPSDGIRISGRTIHHNLADGHVAIGHEILSLSQDGDVPGPGTPSNGRCISGRTIYHALADGHVAVGHEILRIAPAPNVAGLTSGSPWTEKQQW